MVRPAPGYASRHVRTVWRLAAWLALGGVAACQPADVVTADGAATVDEVSHDNPCHARRRAVCLGCLPAPVQNQQPEPVAVGQLEQLLQRYDDLVVVDVGPTDPPGKGGKGGRKAGFGAPVSPAEAYKVRVEKTLQALAQTQRKNLELRLQTSARAYLASNPSLNQSDIYVIAPDPDWVFNAAASALSKQLVARPALANDPAIQAQMQTATREAFVGSPLVADLAAFLRFPETVALVATELLPANRRTAAPSQAQRDDPWRSFETELTRQGLRGRQIAGRPTTEEIRGVGGAPLTLHGVTFVPVSVATPADMTTLRIVSSYFQAETGVSLACLEPTDRHRCDAVAAANPSLP